MNVNDLQWAKSSYSGPNGNCVEVAAGQLPAATPVRDSKRPAGPMLVFGDTGWRAFVDGVKSGDVV